MAAAVRSTLGVEFHAVGPCVTSISATLVILFMAHCTIPVGVAGGGSSHQLTELFCLFRCLIRLLGDNTDTMMFTAWGHSIHMPLPHPPCPQSSNLSPCRSLTGLAMSFPTAHWSVSTITLVCCPVYTKYTSSCTARVRLQHSCHPPVACTSILTYQKNELRLLPHSSTISMGSPISHRCEL